MELDSYLMWSEGEGELEAIMCDPNAPRLRVWVLSACPSLCALVICTTYSSLDLPGICLGLCHVAESERNAHVHLHHPTRLIPTKPTGLKSAVTPSWKSSSCPQLPHSQAGVGIPSLCS